MTTFSLEEKKTFSGNFAAQAVFRARSYPLKNAKSHLNNVPISTILATHLRD
jgi:hypothetical protein